MKKKKLTEMKIQQPARKHRQFLELANRFPNAADPRESKRRGNELGRMIFGD